MKETTLLEALKYEAIDLCLENGLFDSIPKIQSEDETVFGSVLKKLLPDRKVEISLVLSNEETIENVPDEKLDSYHLRFDEFAPNSFSSDLDQKRYEKASIISKGPAAFKQIIEAVENTCHPIFKAKLINLLGGFEDRVHYVNSHEKRNFTIIITPFCMTLHTSETLIDELKIDVFKEEDVVRVLQSHANIVSVMVVEDLNDPSLPEGYANKVAEKMNQLFVEQMGVANGERMSIRPISFEDLQKMIKKNIEESETFPRVIELEIEMTIEDGDEEEDDE